MTPTILQKIIADKKIWLAEQERIFPLAKFQAQVQASERNFYQALAPRERPNYILECKKASPSKGLIRPDFNLDAIAQVYKNYAQVISVLTDTKYFQGDFAYVRQVREQVTQPVLCKDFIISPYQVYLARYYGADAILLMLSVLDDQSYSQLAELAHSLNLGILTETSNEQEVERALALGAKVIGINNRNLHDLSVDLERTLTLRKLIPAHIPVISESGIYTHAQVQALQSTASGFLIGSSLMGSDNLDLAVRKIIYGENKVCGLTQAGDVKAAYQAGAVYGGLIFAPHSPRCLTLLDATNLVAQAPLQYVGVFQNQEPKTLVSYAEQLNLTAVQLHGDESLAYIRQLRELLPETCQIWKAISIPVEASEASQGQLRLLLNDYTDLVERFVLDARVKNIQGGTGQSFNWEIIPPEYKDKIMLAGGINSHNLELALQQHCLGLDLNSGVEVKPGVKDHSKLQQVFTQILTYQG
ncbi:bifunctional indole-3-glycerol phosphate synthase/phosphoribosylanthranilate isomerase [Psittacicella melopsittaci]|uniref:Multifunctional fusion protein n=1 Tax=Psittacicella melopsittaci TaxID=2028576 RepID=A0A3A1Y6H0_9GAMM|nr:bifunctional indole-3-glycerol-phosphate synthase TrpC/phosphoribosylanthranilate isomerase TrpF [Psittacicella melopsittaci]RIY33862.1 bifunctional indole-3-glycerol phosphate synthase/phosphoribosylanthranilate isomerase [Psittacicella melopsittaci]